MVSGPSRFPDLFRIAPTAPHANFYGQWRSVELGKALPGKAVSRDGIFSTSLSIEYSSDARFGNLRLHHSRWSQYQYSWAEQPLHMTAKPEELPLLLRSTQLQWRVAIDRWCCRKDAAAAKILPYSEFFECSFYATFSPILFHMPYIMRWSADACSNAWSPLAPLVEGQAAATGGGMCLQTDCILETLFSLCHWKDGYGPKGWLATWVGSLFFHHGWTMPTMLRGTRGLGSFPRLVI